MVVGKSNILSSRFCAPSRENDLPQHMATGFDTLEENSSDLESKSVVASSVTVAGDVIAGLVKEEGELAEKVDEIISQISILNQLSDFIRTETIRHIYNPVLRERKSHQTSSLQPFLAARFHQILPPGNVIVKVNPDRPYTILKRLGHGAFSTVWQAWDPAALVYRAIKLTALPTDLLTRTPKPKSQNVHTPQDDSQQHSPQPPTETSRTKSRQQENLAHQEASKWLFQSLVREIVLLKGDDHPTILRLYDQFHWTSREANFKGVGTVHDLCKGDLALYLSNNHDKVVLAQKKSWLRCIFDALLHLHERRRVLHLDLKPHNVLVSYDDPWKCHVGDFGLHRELVELEIGKWGIKMDMSNMMNWAGSLVYQPPEHLAASLELHKDYVVTPAFDVWSAGCLAAEILHGKALFQPQQSFRHDYRSLAATVLHSIENWLTLTKTTTELQSGTPSALPADKDVADFIKFLLVADPVDRPNARNCLEHPFLTSAN